jgi:ankyrin repeat protein
MTPLMYAAVYTNPEAVKILLEAGADAQARDKRGRTALICAASTIIHIYVSPEVSVNEAPNFDETVRLLVNAGIDINAKDSAGETALMNLLSNNTESALPYKTLLDAGADVNIANKDGDTIVTELIIRGIKNMDILKILLDAGAPVNAQNNDGLTPLMIAARESGRRGNIYCNIVELLIKAGADPYILSKEGKTALDYADKTSKKSYKTANDKSYDLIKSAMSGDAGK